MTFEEALQYSIQQITGGYVRLRDAIKAREAMFSEDMKVHREQLQIYNAALLKKLQDQKIDSAKTDEGTVYISTVESYTVENWEEFHAFVEETQEPDFLVKNVAGKKVKEWLAEHHTLPPGLKTSRAVNLNVRS